MSGNFVSEADVWDAAQAAHPDGFADYGQRDEYLREAREILERSQLITKEDAA